MNKTPITTWSLLINWCDSDPRQGSFGWSGRADSSEDAERQARTAMLDSSGGEQPCDVMDIGGSIIETYHGANMWGALNGLKFLRAARARINCEWDHPDLVEWGDLFTDATDDILKRIDAVIDELEGRT